jgi:drug/metabolite transporter (DMT)-like permease
MGGVESRIGVDARAYALLTVTAICWAWNAIFGQLAVGEISPMALVALRWLGVLSLLLVFAFRQLRRDWPLLHPRLPYLFAMGALGFTAFNALFYIAAHSTTALHVGIIQGAIPIFVLIGAFAVYRSRITGLQMLGVMLTVVGVVSVGAGGSLSRLASLELNTGDLIMVAACALYAGYTVGLRRRPAAAALPFLTIMAAAALVTAIPLVAVEAALGRFQAPSPTGWLVVVLVTLFPSFLAQLTFIKGVELIGPGRAGVFVNLVPVFAALFAVTFLGESFQLFHGLALGLVLGGIWLSEHGKRS